VNKPQRRAAKPRTRRRGQGRPAGTANGVGEQALISAARKLMRAKPPAELTRLEVAQSTGVDPALIRYYFKDMDGLLVAVLKQMLAESSTVLQSTEKMSGTPEEKLRRRVETFVAFGAANPGSHDLFVRYIINGETDWASEKRSEITKAGFADLKTLVDEGRTEGLFREDFDERFLYILFFAASSFFFRTAGPIIPQLFGADANASNLAKLYSSFMANILLTGIERKGQTKR
jgi:AcrR family transcriptional regulator